MEQSDIRRGAILYRAVDHQCPNSEKSSGSDGAESLRLVLVDSIVCTGNALAGMSSADDLVSIKVAITIIKNVWTKKTTGNFESCPVVIKEVILMLLPEIPHKTKGWWWRRRPWRLFSWIPKPAIQLDCMDHVQACFSPVFRLIQAAG